MARWRWWRKPAWIVAVYTVAVGRWMKVRWTPENTLTSVACSPGRCTSLLYAHSWRLRKYTLARLIPSSLPLSLVISSSTSRRRRRRRRKRGRRNIAHIQNRVCVCIRDIRVREESPVYLYLYFRLSSSFFFFSSFSHDSHQQSIFRP